MKENREKQKRREARKKRNWKWTKNKNELKKRWKKEEQVMTTKEMKQDEENKWRIKNR
jgi:hypothetical protein